MSAATFDPFDLDKPKVRLGSHGEWTLVDATDSALKEFDKREKALMKLAEREDGVKTPALAKAVGDLCEAACEDAEGLSALIVSMCDETACKEADPPRKPVGQHGLFELSKFVLSHFRFQASVGNV